MRRTFKAKTTIGILGGGQLGRMLIQSGINLDITFKVLDPDADAPCSSLADFVRGELTDYQTVMAFGKNCDCITVEIENVNVDALSQLSQMQKMVFPQPSALAIIQDKGRQKLFLKENNFPTADFVLVESKEELIENRNMLPAVNKLRTAGYDGRGVQLLYGEDDWPKAFDAPSVLERMIEIDKEISVIVARNEAGDVSAYMPVEMIFDPRGNLVDYLLAPAQMPKAMIEASIDLARQIIFQLNMVGLLAVEMFLSRDGKLLVNELAPRPHNSGHHTIEANVTSQFEQHLRSILGLPMGNTDPISPAAMVNLLGEPKYTGIARYEGVEKILAVPGAHVHLYGKLYTKPFRKMGHVTILDKNAESLRDKVNFVKNNLKVIS